MKNKRGQVYLFTVIILAFVIYSLYTSTNVVRETIIDDDFEELSFNYDVESAKFVNNLLKNNDPVVDAFERFSKLFTIYAKTKNPEFSLIYFFDYIDEASIDETALYIGNYLDESVVISNGYIDIEIAGCFDKIDTSLAIGGVNLSLGNVDVGDVQSCIVKNKQLSNQQNLLLRIDDVEYPFDVSQNHPEIVIITREKRGEQRKVYTKGKFLNPGEEDE
jgi:hypothetical protein